MNVIPRCMWHNGGSMTAGSTAGVTLPCMPSNSTRAQTQTYLPMHMPDTSMVHCITSPHQITHTSTMYEHVMIFTCQMRYQDNKFRRADKSYLITSTSNFPTRKQYHNLKSTCQCQTVTCATMRQEAVHPCCKITCLLVYLSSQGIHC